MPFSPGNSANLANTGGVFTALVENEDQVLSPTGTDPTLTLNYTHNSLTIDATGASGTLTIEKGTGWVDGSFMNVTLEGTVAIVWGTSWAALRNATQPAGGYTAWGEMEIYQKNTHEYIREVEAA